MASKKVVEQLTEDEYNFLTTIYTRQGNTITGQEQATINTIYSRVFGIPKNKVKWTKCAPCLSARINELHGVYDAYDG